MELPGEDHLLLTERYLEPNAVGELGNVAQWRVVGATAVHVGGEDDVGLPARGSPLAAETNVQRHPIPVQPKPARPLAVRPLLLRRMKQNTVGRVTWQSDADRKQCENEGRAPE